MAGMQVAGVDVDELLDVVGVVAVDLVQLAHQLPLNLQERDQETRAGMGTRASSMGQA